MSVELSCYCVCTVQHGFDFTESMDVNEHCQYM